VVYEANDLFERKSYGMHCRNSFQLDMPWIVEGDFNSLLRIDERLGGDTVQVARLKILCSVLLSIPCNR